MAAVAYADRVKDTTATTGTGNVTLSGSPASGYVAFSTAFAVNQRFFYVISSGADWEVGQGYLSASTTLVRETVLASSNSGAAVSFSAGTKDVFHDLAAAGIPRTGQASISPAGLFGVETAVTDARVKTTSQIMVSVATATYPDELELEPVSAFARCAVDGTLRIRLVSRGRMYSTYTVNYSFV